MIKLTVITVEGYKNTNYKQNSFPIFLSEHWLHM